MDGIKKNLSRIELVDTLKSVEFDGEADVFISFIFDELPKVV